MKAILILHATMLFAASPALAQTSKTVTVDRPNFEATRAVSRDREAGTVSRDASATRKSDGATATRDYDRARTDRGVTASGSATGFGGDTRSFDFERARTDTGSTASGTLTRANSNALTYSGSRSRGNGSLSAQQTVTGSGGRTLYDRQVSATHGDGQISRSVDVNRAAGFHPRAAKRSARVGGRRH